MSREKIKVLYQVNIPSPYRIDFFNELGKNCDLTVLFERYESKGREANWHNYNFDNFKGVFLKGINFKANVALSLEVIKYLKPNKFDIIIIGGYSTPTGMLAISYLKNRKIPFILNVDGGLIPKNEKKIKKIIKKYFLSSANYWLSTGKLTNEYLMYYGASPDNIYIYPFTTMFRQEVLDEPLSIKEKERYKNKLSIKEKKMILTVGRFIYSKGFDVLLKASRNLPDDSGIYIIGGTPTNEYLNLKRELNLQNIHFLDFKEKEDLILYYKASDLFVLPTREDIWGLVINEAMANGLPVITTDKCVAGVELINDYENGFIVPVDNETILNDRIHQLVCNDKLLHNIAKNNIEKISNYTIEQMALVHVDIFRKILLNKERYNE